MKEFRALRESGETVPAIIKRTGFTRQASIERLMHNGARRDPSLGRSSMVKQPVRKCQCASSGHGHRPGKCNELATERDALCKRCSEKTAAELSAEADIPGAGRSQHRPRR